MQTGSKHLGIINTNFYDQFEFGRSKTKLEGLMKSGKYMSKDLES